MDEAMANDESSDGSTTPTWPDAELLLLGKVVQQSAIVELFARHYLGSTLLFPIVLTDALFVGDRFADLHRRLTGAQAVMHEDDWSRSVTDWMAQAAKCMERRDKIVHRSRGYLGSQPVMAPARRKQSCDPVDSALLDQLDQDFARLLSEAPPLSRPGFEAPPTGAAPGDPSGREP